VNVCLSFADCGMGFIRVLISEIGMRLEMIDSVSDIKAER
jgi:hypothetical protein